MNILYKKIVTLGLLVSIALSINGCTDLLDEETSSESSKFEVTIEDYQSTILIQWKRTGDAIHYSHTDLTVINSSNPTLMVPTNSDELINITCLKTTESSSSVNYSCSSSSDYVSRTITLSTNDKTNIEERGYFNSTEDGLVSLGYFQYTNGNLEFIKN